MRYFTLIILLIGTLTSVTKSDSDSINESILSSASSTRPLINHQNTENEPFPPTTPITTYDKQHSINIFDRINEVLTKLDQIKQGTNGDLLMWLMNFRFLFIDCKDFLIKLSAFELTRLKIEAFSSWDQIQSANPTAANQLKTTIQNYLSKLKQFKIQLENEAILPTEETNLIIQLLDDRQVILAIPQTILKKLIPIPESRQKKVEKEKNEIQKAINELNSVPYFLYLTKSQVLANDLKEFGLNINGSLKKPIPEIFNDLNTRFTDLSTEVDKFKKTINKCIGEINSCIPNVAKIVSGTSAELKKTIVNKPLSAKVKDLTTSLRH